jgi:hypothetical protein
MTIHHMYPRVRRAQAKPEKGTKKQALELFVSQKGRKGVLPTYQLHSYSFARAPTVFLNLSALTPQDSSEVREVKNPTWELKFAIFEYN